MFHGCYYDHHASLAPFFYGHLGSSSFVFSFAIIRSPAAFLLHILHQKSLDSEASEFPGQKVTSNSGPVGAPTEKLGF